MSGMIGAGITFMYSTCPQHSQHAGPVTTVATGRSNFCRTFLFCCGQWLLEPWLKLWCLPSSFTTEEACWCISSRLLKSWCVALASPFTNSYWCSCKSDTMSVTLANAWGLVLFVTLHALVSMPLGCMGVWLCMLDKEAWDFQQSGL